MKIRKSHAFRFVGYALVGCLLVLSAKLGLGDRPLDLNNSQAAVPATRSTAMLSPEGVQIPSQVYAVSSEVLAVEVAPPAVTLGQQRPYVAEPQDIVRQRNGRRWVRRGDEVLGLLVGENRDILYSSDVVAESPFVLSQADTPARYEVRSRDDETYAIAQSPTRIFRKTKPVAFARKANGERQWPALTTLYLTLPSPMRPGSTYQLSFPGLGLEDATFAYQPMVARSEAVHVSHLGFRPDDAVKVGYLSTWMGNGGGFDYLDGLRFSVMDTQTDRAVFDGVAVRRRGQSQTEDNRQRDYTLSEVHQLEFGSVTRPGTYRLCVEGVGCSFDFEIGDGVWQAPFKTAARGFYHQRSGIEIGPPFSEYARPRAFHPDDGVVVYQSTAAVLNTKMGIGELDAFEALLAGKTNEVVPNAWGGYFDAGDWDRRTNHLMVPRRLLELHSLFPAYFDAIALNLPESNNDLPDILDEALWSIDFFRRLQMEDGGIRGGVESAAHPNRGETSWQESLTVMAYAPDVWTSYLYAGVAAKAAYVLRPYDAELAEGYADSALRAMAYAEANYVASDYTEGPRLHRVADERNLAALELYRLTGEQAWHELFLATTVFQAADMDARVHTQHDQIEAAFLYAHLNEH
ncbi:MAG: glycoside hydrolase family 9 protein, partial [Cyanobacteria bacterium J06607_10]